MSSNKLRFEDKRLFIRGQIKFCPRITQNVPKTKNDLGTNKLLFYILFFTLSLNNQINKKSYV